MISLVTVTHLFLITQLAPQHLPDAEHKSRIWELKSNNSVRNSNFTATDRDQPKPCLGHFVPFGPAFSGSYSRDFTTPSDGTEH